MCPWEWINLLFLLKQGPGVLKTQHSFLKLPEQTISQNSGIPINSSEIPLPAAGSSAGKTDFFFPSEQGWSRMTHREVFLSFPRLLSRLFLTRDPPGRTLRARWVTSGGSAEVTSSKITRDGLRRSHSHCFGINHPGSCSGNRSEPGTCHGELRAWRDLAKFGQGEGSWCFSWVSSWVG